MRMVFKNRFDVWSCKANLKVILEYVLLTIIQLKVKKILRWLL